MKIRPEAEQRLRAGFQRRVDEQRDRYAAELAHAGQLAARFECGEVVGVFSRQADIGWRNVVPGLLPLAAVPFLIVGAAAGIPGMLPAFGAFLFLFIAWYGMTLWRAMRRDGAAVPGPVPRGHRHNHADVSHHRPDHRRAREQARPGRMRPSGTVAG